MAETVAVAYVKCGFCTAKNHCAACGEELSAALERKHGITSAVLDLLGHTLRVEHSLDLEDLEDLLDGMGLMME